MTLLNRTLRGIFVEGCDLEEAKPPEVPEGEEPEQGEWTPGQEHAWSEEEREDYGSWASTGKKPVREARDLDVLDATELILYAENDWGTYRHIQAAIANLLRKLRKSRYDHKKAQVLWMANTAAQNYGEEMFPETKWFHLFPASVRREAAKELADQYYEQMTDGEWDYLLGKRKSH
jgi:hypothetical protein